MSREKRREQIKEIALKLFAENGYSKTTMDEIIQVVGISKGGMYHHFSNKEEILSLILKAYNESFIVIFNQLNTSENLELFSSDYKGWIEKLIDNLISLEDKE